MPHNPLGYVTEKNELLFFPSSCTIDIIAMDALGPLPTMRSSNQFVLVFTDRYTKLTREIPVTNVAST